MPLKLNVVVTCDAAEAGDANPSPTSAKNNTNAEHNDNACLRTDPMRNPHDAIAAQNERNAHPRVSGEDLIPGEPQTSGNC
jgi:hypothetical protein